MAALDLTAGWPVDHVSAAVVHAGEVVDTVGDIARPFRLASITKPLVGLGRSSSPWRRERSPSTNRSGSRAARSVTC